MPANATDSSIFVFSLCRLKRIRLFRDRHGDFFFMAVSQDFNGGLRTNRRASHQPLQGRGIFHGFTLIADDHIALFSFIPAASAGLSDATSLINTPFSVFIPKDLARSGVDLESRHPYTRVRPCRS